VKRFKVLIDLDRLKDITTGLGQVAEYFGRELHSINDQELEFTFLVPPQFNGYFGHSVKYETNLLKRRYFPSFCPKYDLWYTIHQDSSYFPGKKETPYILTINDLNFMGEKTPAKAKSRLQRLQKKVDKATVITVISKYTEQEVRKYLDVKNIPIHVIYCGVKVNTFENVTKPKFVPDGDLLFSIGVVRPKKNYMVLLDFMKHLPEHYKLIIAGNKSGTYSIELEKRISALGLNHRVFLPGIISDEDKFWMYNHCKAVLFPSKFEGMGFPPVEAMRFGKPVFASTYSSIPEVSEDKAYYWENMEPQYMADMFLKNISDFYAIPQKVDALKQHSMKYTWEENAKAYIKLFKSVLHS
jgi:glycosyltransferase involved in cell wall biosynthesis